jgi:hypothetical protein
MDCLTRWLITRRFLKFRRFPSWCYSSSSRVWVAYSSWRSAYISTTTFFDGKLQVRNGEDKLIKTTFVSEVYTPATSTRLFTSRDFSSGESSNAFEGRRITQQLTFSNNCGSSVSLPNFQTFTRLGGPFTRETIFLQHIDYRPPFMPMFVVG